MQQENTARIHVPPTERINHEETSETQTVRMSPGVDQPSSEQPAELKGEKLFDQYTIYSKIGNGGMGVVYLARDRRLGRFVAIKRLNHQAQTIPSLRQRFLHEARAVATLSHVHIVHIYALGEDDDGPFIVMEYVAGPDDGEVKEGSYAGGLVQPNAPLTLDQHVMRHGQLSAEEAIELLIKVGRAVAYAHASGVIHRDLKPSNILLDKSGEPKIVDFGLARLMHMEESKLTVPGEKLLSLGYGAPEQESDACLSDERSDVYGLGALLYYVITAQNPRYFREQDVPMPLREVVAKALATDKEQRWQSAVAFNEELHRIQTKTRVEVPTVKTTWRCKWCDAINPLAVKFCAECGWDGSEDCPECGEDTFVGVQYCGNCGADARSYETVASLLKKMREAASIQRFEKVISYSGRVHGFEPAGPSGRRLLAELAELREQAEKSILRRAQLKEQVPIEMRAENYERAAAFIKQYRDLSEDKRAFEEELRQLPELTLRRDLARARKAIKDREWTAASRICDILLREVAPDNPDVLGIRRMIRLHALWMNFLSGFVLLCCLAVFYLLSLPPAVRALNRPFSRAASAFYRPGLWAYNRGAAAASLQWYARLWLDDLSLLTGCCPTEAETAAAEAAAAVEAELPDDLKAKQHEYERQLLEIGNEQKAFQQAWPAEYIRELEALMERRRAAGDFDGWAVVQAERKRFDEIKQITGSEDDDRSELTMLKNKYGKMRSDQRLLNGRKLVSLCKKYVNELTDIQKTYTQQGHMDMAKTVNAEIRRVRNTPEQLAAEALLAESSVAGAPDAESASQVLLMTAAEKHVQEVPAFREEFEKELTEIERSAADMADKWPEQYVADLNELMEKFQRAGDFVAWESVRDESLRFGADRAILSKDILSQSGELAQLQRKYFNLRDEHRRKRAERLVEATEGYVKRLQELQRNLTVAGEMDAAATVNTEIRRVRARVDFIEAHNEILPQGPPAPIRPVDIVAPADGG
ncbi:MAG: serine/threonine-protein kinase [Kiritimatiellae bacterium]|nr:serine/threonine-protein kinase [Kiritimatiellia bacterium]